MGIPLLLSDVPNATPYIQYVAASGQTLFPYPFPITQDSDLIAVVNGVTLNTDAGYSLTGQGNDTGGNLIFTLGQTAGAVVTLFRDIPIERISQIAQNSGFSSTVFNAEFNNIYLIMQQLEQAQAFSLQIPNTNNPPGNPLLTPAAYANKFLGFDSFGNPQPSILTSAGTLSAAIIGGLISPVTAAETATGVTVVNVFAPVGRMDRYGIVPNNSGVATANTTAIKALFNQTIASGPSGRFTFPNTTGTDIYYFNGVIPCRDGISIDLGGCTLQYTGAVLAGDTNSGLFFAIRDFEIFGGAIKTAVDTSLATSSGYAVQLGARDNGTYFSIFDSTLPTPMGNCKIRDLHITINNTGSNVSSTGGIQIIGGLQNCEVSNISIDGSTTAANGIDYEFGWATSGTTNLRQTSHAHNMVFRNIRVQNLLAQTGTAITLAGMYNAVVENLYCNGVGSCVDVTTGESLFYRPWAGIDTIGVKRNISLRNIIGQSLTGPGIGFNGAVSAAGGYLAGLISGLGHPADYLAETDLGAFSLDGFALDGSANIAGFGNGINLAGCTRAEIRNGTITGGFLNGIVAQDETNALILESVNIHGALDNGVSLGGFPIWSPARKAKVRISNCYIAGNSTSSAGAFPGISVGANYDSVLIEHNHINYDSAYHGTDETTQGPAVQVDVTGPSNVVCKYNHVGVVIGGVAYFNLNTTTPSNGFYLEGNTGVVTYSGLWDGVEQAWTPVLTCATPGNLAVSYTTQAGGYTKKGNQVEFWFNVVTSAFTHTAGESGGVKLTGLPYAPTATANMKRQGALAFGGITKASYTQFTSDVEGTTPIVQFFASGSGQAPSQVVIGDLPTAGTVTLQGSGSYFAAP